MTRLHYLVLAGVLSFVPLGLVWASESPPSTTSGVTRSGYYHPTNVFYSGGRGSWFGNSYGAGHGGYDTGGSSRYRGGGPGGGGK